MTNEHRTVRKVAEEVTRWQQLRSELEELDIDDATLFDSLDGETELTDALLMLSEEIAERETMAIAVGIRVKEMTERKSRIDNTINTLRAIITLTIERMGGKRSIKGDLSTLTVSDTPANAEIIQEERIPSRFFKAKDPALDKAALTKALRDGEDIEGARLSGKGLKLTIRRA